MKRKWWKWTGFLAVGLILSVGVLVYFLTYSGTNIYPNVDKRHAMIRLEDVGLGGEYNSLDGLGKLRAVIEYMESEQVPFHIAVIPRRISLEAERVWEEMGIDDPSPDPIVKAFIKLLQEAEAKGGVLGMHGYSHQYGDTVRDDDGQNSGTGSEFKVSGAPVTREADYAAMRITNSLAAFAKAGLQPAFWESPHYRNTREQEKVFRSFVGILYQPDLFSLRSFKDMNVYEQINNYGQTSLGSIYVPAPLKYISDVRSVDRILSKAADWNGLASMYLHPFLEFPYMELVTDPDGNPLFRAGLPVYQYKEDATESYLHRLVNGFKQEGYRWVSLYDITLFSPAHRVNIQPGMLAQQVLLGDVFGAGEEDVVVRGAQNIVVIPGTYTWPRNRPQQAGEVWLKEAFALEEQLLLADLNGNGKDDLVAYNEVTGELRVSWANNGQFLSPESLGRLPADLHSLQAFKFSGETGLIALGKNSLTSIRRVNDRLEITEEKQLRLPQDAVLYTGHFRNLSHEEVLVLSPTNHEVSLLVHKQDGRFESAEQIADIPQAKGEQFMVGDPNGDGLSDLIVYRAKTGVWRVYENKGNGQFYPLDNDMGPWAHREGRVGFVADFDGNGKTDISSYDEDEHVLDIALSYRD